MRVTDNVRVNWGVKFTLSEEHIKAPKASWTEQHIQSLIVYSKTSDTLASEWSKMNRDKEF